MTFKTIEQYGPSLLDQFAMAAMSGMLRHNTYCNMQCKELAKCAYNVADAMCNERQRRIDIMKGDANEFDNDK